MNLLKTGATAPQNKLVINRARRDRNKKEIPYFLHRNQDGERVESLNLEHEEF